MLLPGFCKEKRMFVFKLCVLKCLLPTSLKYMKVIVDTVLILNLQTDYKDLNSLVLS